MACDTGYTLAGEQPSCDDGVLTESVECIEDIDCVGAWPTCQMTCAEVAFGITTTQSGSGQHCEFEHGALRECAGGDGECQLTECRSVPCANGGLCADAGGEYVCQCVSGYGGANCADVVDECTSAPCLGRGSTCTDGDDAYTCQCGSGFTGTNCADADDDCGGTEAENPCAEGVNGIGGSGGVCHDIIAGGKCETANPNSATDEQAQACLERSGSEDDCAAGEACLYTAGYQCHCDEGFYGFKCQYATDGFASCTDTQRTATCDETLTTCIVSDDDNVPVCLGNLVPFTCYPGYTTSDNGLTCTPVDDCSPSPCLNGGACTDSLLRYSCDCVVGYAGYDCEHSVSACGALPCSRGTCADVGTGYECTCEEGWGGINCDTVQISEADTVYSDCTGLSAPANGALGGCQSDMLHGASCSFQCNVGYTLSGVQPSCDDGTVTESVVCLEDINCVGAWSVCAADCGDKSYSVSEAQSGSGSACEASHGDTATCSPGDGDCPSECTGLSAPAHGVMSGCPSVLGHGLSCTMACDTGYTLAGERPSCDDGVLTESVECIEDVNCVGAWSECSVGCTKEYSVSVAQSGSGSACGAAAGDVGSCVAGEGECPSDCTGLVAPENGSIDRCPSVLGHGLTCAMACDTGYTLAGEQPSCDDGV
eukprot:COSAG06_NODE_9067_length_1995_cov_4.928270_1_plen_652_part_10